MKTRIIHIHILLEGNILQITGCEILMTGPKIICHPFCNDNCNFPIDEASATMYYKYFSSISVLQACIFPHMFMSELYIEIYPF